MGAPESAQGPAARPGLRVFGGFCWDLAEVGAPESAQGPAARPGQRVFDGLCWDLDKVGAPESAQGPAANPGERVFGGFCWDLAEEEGALAEEGLIGAVEATGIFGKTVNCDYICHSVGAGAGK